MTERALAPVLPPDPGLPGVRGLFRAGGSDLLGPFLTSRSWSLVESRPVQVTYQPGRPLRAVAVRSLRYRPRRRAVFRYTGLHGGRRSPGPEALFGKVLRSANLERWTRVLGLRLPRDSVRLAVPISSPGDGSLLFEPLEGRSLRDILIAGAPLPSPERVAGLLDELPRVLGDHPGDHDAERSLRTAAATREVVARVAPEATASADRLVDLVSGGARRDAVPPRTVHGDLYEAQVFVGRGYTLGLIDLDDAGPGDPAMDAGTFLAHLVALALVFPSAGRRILAYRTLVRDAFLDRLGIAPVDLAWRGGPQMFHPGPRP